MLICELVEMLHLNNDKEAVSHFFSLVLYCKLSRTCSGNFIITVQTWELY